MNAPKKITPAQIEAKIALLQIEMRKAESINSAVQYRKMFGEADDAEADAAALAVAEIKSKIAALTAALLAATHAEDEWEADLLRDMRQRVVSDAQRLAKTYETALREVFAYVERMAAVLQAEQDARTDLLLALGQPGGLSNASLVELVQGLRFSQRDASFLAHRLYCAGLGEIGAIGNEAKFLPFATVADDLVSAKLEHLARVVASLNDG